MAEVQLEESDLKTLLAIADTVIAELTPHEIEQLREAESLQFKNDKTRFLKFAQAKFSDDEACVQHLKDTIDGMAPFRKKAVVDALRFLNTVPGKLLFTGSLTPFHELSRVDRENVLVGCYSSRIPLLRTLSKTFLTLCCVVYWKACNESRGAIGYSTKLLSEKIVSKAPDYKFLEPDDTTTDVLIIGSGSGGGVVAATLAKAGRKVLVLEKGVYYDPAKDLPFTGTKSLTALYDENGLLGTEDNGIPLFLASTFGGGSTVNWSASLQLPYTARKEWAEVFGLTQFQTEEFQDANDFVCRRMGVKLPGKHNFANRIMLEGCRKLGYPCTEVPQNIFDPDHQCGHACTNGCRGGWKQGSVQTWLKDAKDNGAQFMTGVLVDKVVVENGVAKGADCVEVASGKKFRITANTVVVSGGSIHSPAILQRSGLKNKNIGQNLHLHPVSLVFGYYDETTNPTDGMILTTAGHPASNRDGLGHGAVMECSLFEPPIAAVMQPWRSALDHKRLMSRWNQGACFISLARDRDSGRVYADKETGLPRMEYALSKFDRQSMIGGVLRLCDVVLITGANEIQTSLFGVPTFYPKKDPESVNLGIMEPSYVAFKKKIEEVGVVLNGGCVANAHQIGTCRMGNTSANSVVDPSGKVWGVDGLYVADASVLPSASGVNPMITTMAVSYMIAKGIPKEEIVSRL